MLRNAPASFTEPYFNSTFLNPCLSNTNVIMCYTDNNYNKFQRTLLFVNCMKCTNVVGHVHVGSMGISEP